MTDFDMDADFEELVETLQDLQEQAGGGGSYFVGTAVEYSVFRRIRDQQNGREAVFQAGAQRGAA